MNKSIVRVLFVTIFLCVGTHANAAFFDLEITVPATGEAEVTTFNRSYEANFHDMFTFTLVSDQILFTLASDAVVSFALDDISSASQAGFRKLDFRLYDGGFDYVQSFGGFVPLPLGDKVLSLSGASHLQSSDFVLAAGTYSSTLFGIIRTGTDIDDTSGDYALSITAAGDVSPVPIPAAGLLFFSGIAALSLTRKHRS